jgi:hypothetical protein
VVSAAVWRRAAVACAGACAVAALAVSPALAERARATRTPDELWRAYPLEQTTPSTAATPARPSASPLAGPRPAADTTSGSPSGGGRSRTVRLLIAGALVVAAVAVAVEALPFRRRPRRRRARLRARRAGPPVAPRVNGGAPSENGRPVDPRGPVCEVRWRSHGTRSWFSAVTVDADGVERTVATSPLVPGRGASPPERTPETQAALRRLSKTLRDEGWRPMRTKAKHGGWYGRRFRLPATEPAAREDDAVGAEPAPR